MVSAAAAVLADVAALLADAAVPTGALGPVLSGEGAGPVPAGIVSRAVMVSSMGASP